eukprot:5091798-Amphidinium_carterae.1
MSTAASSSDTSNASVPNAEKYEEQKRAFLWDKCRQQKANSRERKDKRDRKDGWDWSGKYDDGDRDLMDIDQLKLTPISELHVHREPYEEPPHNPLSSIEHNETFEGGRDLNPLGHQCIRCVQRYVLSSVAWIKTKYDPVHKGPFVHLCNFMDEDYAHILRMQKERDPKMQAIHSNSFVGSIHE